MRRNYWLLKSEPSTYSWDDLVELGRDHWDGVRNYQARNNLRDMRPGDRALFYHSVKAKAVVGVAEVVSDPYPDPTSDDPRWSVVDVKPVFPLKQPVTLATIKAEPALAEIALIKQARLSVMPLSRREFDTIVGLGGKGPSL